MIELAGAIDGIGGLKPTLQYLTDFIFLDTDLPTCGGLTQINTDFYKSGPPRGAACWIPAFAGMTTCVFWLRPGLPSYGSLRRDER
jgi:hypothetical protein